MTPEEQERVPTRSVGAVSPIREEIGVRSGGRRSPVGFKMGPHAVRGPGRQAASEVV